MLLFRCLDKICWIFLNAFWDFLCVSFDYWFYFNCVTCGYFIVFPHTYNIKTCIFVLQTNRKYYLFLLLFEVHLHFLLFYRTRTIICFKWMRVDMNISCNDIFVLCVYFDFNFFCLLLLQNSKMCAFRPLLTIIAWTLLDFWQLYLFSTVFIARALDNSCYLAKEASFIVLFLKMSAKLI